MKNRPLLFSLAILGGFSLTINLIGNDNVPLFDRDEPRFAQAAREMMETRDFIVPHFNGQPRYDKPVLIYWLMSLSYLLFGVNEFAARLPSVLCGTAATLLTALWGIRIHGGKTGLAAGWILATSLLFILESKAATADALLLLCMVITFRCLYEIIERTDSIQHRAGFWIALALATLTKGPVAIAIIGMASLIYGFLSRDWKVYRGLSFKWGVPLYLLLVLPWWIAALIATGGEFWTEGIGHHVFKRSLQPLEGHRGFPGFHLISLLGTFLPWGLLLPGILVENLKGLREDRPRMFLLACLIGPWLLFELVQTKLPHYMLPSFPALALLVAGYLGSEEIRKRKLHAQMAGIAAGIALVLLMILIVMMPGILRDAGLRLLERPILQILGAFILLMGTGYALFAGQRIGSGFAMLVLSSVLLVTLTHAVLNPHFRELQIAPRVAESVQALSGLRTRPIVWGSPEPSFIFYLDGAAIVREATALAEEIKQSPHPVLLAQEDTAIPEGEAWTFRQQQSFTGYNFAKGKPVTWKILAVYKKE